MLKSVFFKKTVCITTVFSFVLANIPQAANAYGYRLMPESFEEMYALAQSGRVEALRSSVNRGLNIDVMNQNGDTGLCVAARRHDSYTYNSFRAAGANPHHPCTQNIIDYEDFIRSSRAVSVTSTPRAAYGAMGKEEYGISPRTWWWVGGIALVGGALALALGGGGGGGGSSSDDSSHDNGGGNNSEDYSSLGSIAGTQGIINKYISGNSAENTSYIQMSNANTEKVKNINFNSSVLSNTKYLDTAILAKDAGKYTNKKDTVLKIGEGVVGMVALKDSQINNFGYINADSYNASIGMLASENSTAVNYGEGIISGNGNNGISLNFSGYEDGYSLIGMYADTKSTLQNFGDIKGTAMKAASSSGTTDDDSGLVDDLDDPETKISAASGSIIGMEAMIVNAGSDLNRDTINLLNQSSGKINLSAGDAGSTDGDVKVSMIGMGSFLDDGFLNGSKNINRAENVVMRNYGDITLGYTGNYAVDSSVLRKGQGGIVGMRADAKTSAFNLGNININMEEYSAGSSNVDVAAGMQSVHGGDLSNSGNINITTSSGNQRKSYGMLSVEGSGSVSGLYTNLNHSLTNTGDISVQASNSFGMASFNGGTLKNTGRIVLGKEETTTLYEKNIAMYAYGKSKEATMENTGTIDIYSHDSIAMQNDFAGGTSIYNKGTINVHESATNSYVFGGAYSEAHNSKVINYYANSDGEVSSAGKKYNPFANYSVSVGNSIISTQSRSVLGESEETTTSSNTEKIYNDENAIINMEGSSYVAALAVEAGESEETQGKAYNNGTINISDSLYKNATNAVGMYLGRGAYNNAFIVNNKNINTNSIFSAAMVNLSEKNASMINNGDITANFRYSLGMYSSGVSNTQNNKNINMNGDNSVGIYSAGKATIINSEDGKITIGTNDTKTENSYGVYLAEGSNNTSFENNGLIDVYTKIAGAGVYAQGSELSIKNKNTININGDDAYGIYINGDDEETNNSVVNDENAVINVGSAAQNVSRSYGIYNESGGEISNKGTINLFNDSGEKGYAIYSTGNAEITNEGTINLNNENGTAIYAQNGKVFNKNTINLNYDNLTGLEAAQNAEVINETNGIINVGKESAAVSNSNGMYYSADVSSDEETGNGILTNNGVIYLYSVENGNSHAVSINGNATFNNNKTIKSFNDNSSAIYVSRPAKVNNSGEIIVEGSSVYAIEGVYSSEDNEEESGGVSVNNSGKITVGIAGADGFNSYGIFAKTIDSIINSGNITIYNNGSYAVYAENGNTISNTGIINMEGENNTAIFGGEVNAINNRGQISIKQEGGKGIYTTGSGTITNSNVITLNKGNNGYGIYATGEADIRNDSRGVITIGNALETAEDGYGIYAVNANNITNNAAIYLYAKGNAITGGDSIINTARLNLYQNNSKGIASNGTSIENSGVIRIIDSGNNYGIYSTGEVNISNSGEIIIGSALNMSGNDHGIYALNSSGITNNAPITIYTSGTAITGGNGIVNNANLTLYQNNSKGISSNGNSIENNGAISVLLSEGSYGLYSTGEANIINNAGGVITLGGSGTTYSKGAYGIYAQNANSITNNALLNIYAQNSYGIDGNASSSIINNGNINLYNSNNTGIRSSGTSTISNSKKINITGAENSYGIRATSATITTDVDSSIVIGSSGAEGKSGNYGIYALEGTISNSGNISVYGGGHGIYGQGSSSIINNGNIMLQNSGSIGIGTEIGNITNNGFINMLGSTAYGIYSQGSGTITNGSVAHINVKNGWAIYATRNTSVVNNGHLLVSGEGVGINNASSVDNSGSITVGKGTAINSGGNVTNSGSITVNDVGTAVDGFSLDNSGNIETSGGTAVSVSGSVTNTGNILVNGNGTVVEKAMSLNNSGMISVNSGTAISNVRDVSNSAGGTIKTSYGSAIECASSISNSGTIIGTEFAVNGGTELTNNEGGLISISDGTAAISGVSTVTNNGTIEVTGKATAAIFGATNVTNNGIIRVNDGHGIYTKNPGTIINNGTISVNNGNGHGIYVEIPYVNSTVTITNTGNISVKNGYAIYVVKHYALNTEKVTDGDRVGTKYTDNTTINPGVIGEDSVVYGGECGQHCKNGEISWGGYYPASSLISVSDRSLLNNIRLLNIGQISLSGNVDFGSVEDNTSSAAIGKNGQYEADSFSGTVLADSSLVKGGFDTVYVNENAFVGEDNGLDVLSKSYLFDASLKSNEEGNLDVVMTMSKFEDKVENAEISEFLSQNYQEEKGEEIFNVIKSAETREVFNNYLNRELGLNIIPNFAKQSLDMEKTVNTELNNDLLDKTTESSRHKTEIFAYKNKVDSKNNTSGYKDKVIAAYGFSDKAINNRLRAGFALSVISSDSDFDDGSSRYNNMLEVSTPVIFSKNNTSVMFKPKAGFARGNYRRNAVNQVYKAKTKDFYYGFDSAVSHDIDLDIATVEPVMGFNLTGLYNDDIRENKGGLKVKSNNTLSALFNVGANMKKEFVFNQDNSLSLIAGGKYFYEAGERYNNRASFGDMNGFYSIDDNRLQRNYGLLSAKVVYRYKPFSVSTSVNVPLEQKHNPYYLLNFGYRF